MSNKNLYYGLRWTEKSCWMDSSLMALFFSTSTNAYFSRFVENHNNEETNHIKNETLYLINSIQETNNQDVSVDSLRDHLNKYAMNKKDRKMITAFERSGNEGYVYYFLIEFLRLFNVPPLIGRPIVGTNQEMYILELQDCGRSSIEDCLNNSYRGWRWKQTQPYLIVESNTELSPQENILWNSSHYTLKSMIVFNCSHFVTYVRRQNVWYLYDGGRTYKDMPLQVTSFGGEFYSPSDHCPFIYGQTNTFFFYMQDE